MTAYSQRNLQAVDALPQPGRIRRLRERFRIPAVLKSLAASPLTVAGLGCIDAAAFVGNLIAGLVVTGISLIALELMISDNSEVSE